MLLSLKFVEDEVLECRGLEGGGELSVPDFLERSSMRLDVHSGVDTDLDVS